MSETAKKEALHAVPVQIEISNCHEIKAQMKKRVMHIKRNCKNVVPKDDKKTCIDTLVKSQNEEGCWTDKGVIQNLAKCEIKHEELTGKELNTVYAIAILSANGAQSHESVKNAYKWLESQDPSYDWIKAVGNAKEKIMLITQKTP